MDEDINQEKELMIYPNPTEFPETDYAFENKLEQFYQLNCEFDNFE